MARFRARSAWLFVLQVVPLVVLLPAPALGEDRDDRILSPYFLLEGSDPGTDGFPLKGTRVEARVNGVIADVTVTQIYANEGSRPVNARYVFPGSTRASVHGMRMTVGGEVVVAKIAERKEARREFETARREGKIASLLEQQRPNVFTMNVANILPGDEVEVQLHYTELLVPEEGIYQLVYPSVVGPRYSSGPGKAAALEPHLWVASPYLRAGAAPPPFQVRVTLSTGIPLQDVKSPSHAVNVDWAGEALAEVSLADPSGAGGNRDFILDYRLAGTTIQSGLLLYRGERENFFLMMMEPPERVREEEIPPREYIFVLDVSGSMDGFPLETARSLIADLIGHLRPTDTFNVVLFAGGSRVMAPASVPATEANVGAAIRVIEQERGGGGTEIVSALERAMALPRDEQASRTVVVITDGFVDAEAGVFDLIRKNLNRSNLFSFGIGSGVNRYLVEGMARAGMGEPFVATDPVQAAAAAARFREYVASPVLTRIGVSFEGFDAYDVEPETLPDLFASRPVVLFGKWRGELFGQIEVSGEGAGRSYSRAFSVAETTPLEANAPLRHLWARARLARLSDFSFGREEPGVAEKITRLGLTYSLLTSHTSFIAVLEKARPLPEPAKDIDQPQPLPDRVSEMAVGGGYAAGPEPGIWVILAVAALLIALTAPRRRVPDPPVVRRGPRS